MRIGEHWRDIRTGDRVQILSHSDDWVRLQRDDESTYRARPKWLCRCFIGYLNIGRKSATNALGQNDSDYQPHVSHEALALARKAGLR